MKVGIEEPARGALRCVKRFVSEQAELELLAALAFSPFTYDPHPHFSRSLISTGMVSFG